MELLGKCFYSHYSSAAPEGVKGSRTAPGASKQHTECTWLWEQRERMEVKCYIDFAATGTSVEVRKELQALGRGSPRGTAQHSSRGAGGADPHSHWGAMRTFKAIPSSASVLGLVLQGMFTTFLQRVRG